MKSIVSYQVWESLVIVTLALMIETARFAKSLKIDVLQYWNFSTLQTWIYDLALLLVY